MASNYKFDLKTFHSAKSHIQISFGGIYYLCICIQQLVEALATLENTTAPLVFQIQIQPCQWFKHVQTARLASFLFGGFSLISDP